jgi:hypothetical protein
MLNLKHVAVTHSPRTAKLPDFLIILSSQTDRGRMLAKSHLQLLDLITDILDESWKTKSVTTAL